MNRIYFLCLVGALLHGEARAGEQAFPAIRVSELPLEAVWRASPIVAIGNITNITTYGHQTVSRLPYPTSPDVHDLYWCRGDFEPVAVIKGELRESKQEYLWASTIPGCQLFNDNPKLIYKRLQTKFWFLRIQGGVLRPTFDYDAPRFGGVFPGWSQGPLVSPRQKLGTLLLTPSANTDSLDDYSRYLWRVGGIACELLGRASCIKQIALLQNQGNAVLAKSACGFLVGELGVDCKSK